MPDPESPSTPIASESEIAEINPVEGASDGATLVDRDDDQDERGRIGYGRNERMSSYMLGGVLIAVILAIGLYSVFSGGDDGEPPASAERRPAPDFQMTQFDGTTFNLANHRGQVVVLNIWASWCIPCQKEMPALQAASERYGDDVVFVGVGVKADKDDEARAFAEQYGITYPIGRDTEGGTAAQGKIAQDYGVFGYPTTYFIDPEGNISATIVNELDTSMIDTYIDQARANN